MKKLISLAAFSLGGALMAQTSILVDLGLYDLQSSAETDPNGYHWNNIAPEADASNGVFGWELLTEEQKAAYENPGVHYSLPGILPYPAVVDAVDNTGAVTCVDITFTSFVDGTPDRGSGGHGRATLEYGDDLGPIPTMTGYAGTATVDSLYINFRWQVIYSVSGLNDSQTYTLRMWGGQPRDSRPAAFSVNGNIEGQQVIETFNNTGANDSDYAVFENVSPVDGVITIQYEQGVPEGNTPNGQWSVLEIIGDFSSSGGGGDTWLGYTVDSEGWVNTESWIGWVNVLDAPWIWSSSLSSWLYIADDSGWVFIPR